MSTRDLSGRWQLAAAGVGAVLAVVTVVLRANLDATTRRHDEEAERGLREMQRRLATTPHPDPTAVEPVPGFETDGWAVDAMEVWCDGEVWAGNAAVHATTSSADRLTFDFTLYDGTTLVGHLRGRHDGTAVKDQETVPLRSADPCVDRPVRYRYEVT